MNTFRMAALASAYCNDAHGGGIVSQPKAFRFTSTNNCLLMYSSVTDNIRKSLFIGLSSDKARILGGVMNTIQTPSRRLTYRVTGPSDLWVFWTWKKHEDLSRVLDLSIGGLSVSVEKPESIAVGEKIHLNFLTPEGQIRADAVVRHVRPERMGLKFIAINEEDRTHLKALMTGLRNPSRR